MVERLVKLYCRLRVRGRHVSVYVITTLMFIVIAVQRRGSTGDTMHHQRSPPALHQHTIVVKIVLVLFSFLSKTSF